MYMCKYQLSHSIGELSLYSPVLLVATYRLHGVTAGEYYVYGTL